MKSQSQSQSPQPGQSPSPASSSGKEKKPILSFSSPFSKEIKFGSFFGDSKDDAGEELERLRQKVENLESELSIQKEMAQNNVRTVVDENEKLKKIILEQDEKIKQQQQQQQSSDITKESDAASGSGGDPPTVPARPGEVEGLRRECEVLRIKISAKDGEIEELSRGRSDLQRAQEDLEKATAERAALEQRCTECEAERNRAREDYNKLRKEVDTLKLRMEVLRDDCTAAQQKAAQLTEDLSKARSDLAAAQEELRTSQEGAAAAAAAKDAHIEELEARCSAHGRTAQENAELAARVCALDAECKEKAEAIRSLEEARGEGEASRAEANALAEQLAAANAKVAALTAELDAARAETEKASADNAAQVEALRKAGEDQRAAYEVQGRKSRQLIKELKGELHKYRQAYEAITRSGGGGSSGSGECGGGDGMAAEVDCGILTTADFEEVGVQLGKVAQEKFLLEERCSEYERENATLKKELEEWKAESTQKYIASCMARVALPQQQQPQQQQPPTTPQKKHRFFGGGGSSSSSSSSNSNSSDGQKDGMNKDDTVMSTMKGIVEDTLIRNIQLRK